MSSPLASVILPTLDRAATLPFALKSVQEQTEGNLEILIVLDGSPEACRAIVSPNPLAVILTAYSIRASFFAIHELMRDTFTGLGN